LLENAKKYDQTTVTFDGEVIGQKIKEGNGYWINVLDKEGNAIGVYMTSDQSNRIGYFGNHKTSGDILLLAGVFFKTCIQHGGETDIHLTKIIKIEKGKAREVAPIHQSFLFFMPILFVFSIFLYYKKRKSDSCNIYDQ